jgi:hypothetical protein
MKLIIIIISLVLLSSLQTIQAKSEICKVFPFYDKKVSSCKPVPETLVEIKTMPENDISQDSLSCSYANAYYMAQEYVCYTNSKTRKNENCDLSKRENSHLSLSPLEPLFFTEINNEVFAGTGVVENKGINSVQSTPLMMRKIQETFIKQYGFTNNECINYDAFVNTFGNDIEKFEAFLKRISDVYDQLKPLVASKDSIEGVGNCSDCDREMSSIYEKYLDKFRTHSNNNLKNLSNSDNIKEFIFRLLFEGCSKPNVETNSRLTPTLIHIPSSKNEILNNTDIKQKIINAIVKEKRPLTANYFCIKYEVKNGKNVCIESHALALTGYQKCCDTNNNCQDIVKIKNSWGQNWQKNYCTDAGNNWVIMDEFLNKFAKKEEVLDSNEPLLPLSLSYFAPVEIEKIEKIEALKASKK